MKKFLIASLLGCVLTGAAPAAAQTVWAPVGAEWNYSFRLFSGYGVVRYRAVRDTVVQGRACRLIKGQLIAADYMYPNLPPAVIDFGWEIMYADTDRVYYLRDGQFYTWADFNARPGDSWQVKGQACLGANRWTTLTVTVDSAGTMRVGGQNLRWIRLKPQRYPVTVSDSSTFMYYRAGRIVERIGHLVNLPPDGYCGSDPALGAGLLCYGEPSGYQYGVPNCASVVLATPPTWERVVTVNPNPSADGRYRIDGPGEANYEVLDARGRRVTAGKVEGNAELDLSTQPAGLYVLRLTDAAGHSVSRRLVRE